MKRTALLWLILIVCLPVGLFSQMADERDMSFFEQRAEQDAKYEQDLQLPSVEDEIDYWIDQNNFEEDLKKLSYKGYQVYLNSKRKAYSQHELQCGEDCKHGDYYYLQAAFYFQNGIKEYSGDEIAEIKKPAVTAKD